MRVAATTLLLAALVQPLLAAKDHDFKKCHQSGFCKRGRALSERAYAAGKSWSSPYSIDSTALSFSPSHASFTAPVKSSLYPDIRFELKVSILEDGIARVTMDEVNGLRQRYNEAAKWALLTEPQLKDASSVKWEQLGNNGRKAVYDGVELRIQYSPLSISLWRDGREEILLNGRGLLHMEHFRSKETISPPPEGQSEEGQAVLEDESSKVKPTAWFEGDMEESYWEETWSTWTDSKPKGPESLSIDIDFPNHGHIYGIPQHAAPLSLPDTTGISAFFSEPYRLYNGDIFEYPASSSDLSLYGSIPLLHAHSTKSTVGVFNLVASETWIDTWHPTPDKSTQTHWISESGILDVFLIPGPTPADVIKQYARLTGTAAMPAHWALGHHQCRWNYVSSDDVRTVSKKFDEDDIPMDVIWLDIEYSEEHKYMIWEDSTFPDPLEMASDVATVGRKMVVIVDPHLKRVSNYPVYDEAEKNGMIVKKAGGDDYEGWCWSGSSAWVDFFNPASTEWWRGLFSLVDKKGSDGWRWRKSSDTMFIWNDMNEPAVFNGPEITMPKDNVHHDGWEHRDVHNVNGMLFQKATALALVNRTGDGVPKRPFVLSRSFYAGSQRWGAVWTGDNMGTWEHMAVGIPITLTDSIAGIQFIGADVGGFFGNPTPEMLVRWYQVGAFAPFFRAHAHIDTKRREPYLMDEPFKSMLRDTLRLRYTLLPVWYTAAREASATGLPSMRPQYLMFPQDAQGFAIDDQYYVGTSGLLVKPVTRAAQKEQEIYLSDDEAYYDYFDYTTYHGAPKGIHVTVPAPMEKVPVLIRGGSIVPTRQRPRRASTAMKNDPFTLTVALSSTTSDTLAEGELYMDDGETYAHTHGELIWRGFTAKRSSTGKTRSSRTTTITLSSRDRVEPALSKGEPIVEASNTLTAPSTLALGKYDPENNAYAKLISDVVVVERVIVLGLPSKPTAVKLAGRDLEFTYEEGVSVVDPKIKKTGKTGAGKASKLVIKNPKASIVASWDITISL
ncbi:alpha-glucosidase [Clavulina sp. PMI_390]|nr:alpha-glucosidase [Clavulina sp. PMI_390]